MAVVYNNNHICSTSQSLGDQPLTSGSGVWKYHSTVPLIEHNWLQTIRQNTKTLNIFYRFVILNVIKHPITKKSKCDISMFWIKTNDKMNPFVVFLSTTIEHLVATNKAE